MMRSMTLLAAALLALAACDEKKTDVKQDDPATKNASGTTTTTNTTATATATAAAQPVTIDDKDLATPSDFEEAAEKSITKANYKNELTQLETDINKE